MQRHTGLHTQESPKIPKLDAIIYMQKTYNIEKNKTKQKVLPWCNIMK